MIKNLIIKLPVQKLIQKV